MLIAPEPASSLAKNVSVVVSASGGKGIVTLLEFDRALRLVKFFERLEAHGGACQSLIWVRCTDPKPEGCVTRLLLRGVHRIRSTSRLGLNKPYQVIQR